MNHFTSNMTLAAAIFWLCACNASLNFPIRCGEYAGDRCPSPSFPGAGDRDITGSVLKNTVFTIAGQFWPKSAEGKAATLAFLVAPYRLDVDSVGNIYYVDSTLSVVRRIDHATGVITTFAGIGSGAGSIPTYYLGDGGLAVDATFGTPYDIKLDTLGNAFVSDVRSNTVRRIDAATGIVSTVAGNGVQGFSGDGGLATAATLNQPYGIALDSFGNLYIADGGNKLVRKVTASTGIITTIAGTGANGYSGDGGPALAATFNQPSALAVDANGDLYVLDYFNLLRKITFSTGNISTVAGNQTPGYSGDGGLASSARIANPWGLSSDGAGNILIADTANNVIRKITVADGKISTVIGTGVAGNSGDGGPPLSAQLKAPRGVVSDSGGNIYVADTGNLLLRKFSSGTGYMSTVGGIGPFASYGDGGDARDAIFSQPNSVVLDTNYNLYFPIRHQVKKIDAATGTISNFAGTGIAGYSGDGGPASAARLNNPIGIAVDLQGNVFLSDSFNSVIRKVDALTGTITTFAGTGTGGNSGDGGLAINAKLTIPWGLAIDSGGNLYIADNSSGVIRKVNAATGIISKVVGTTTGYSGNGGPATAAQISGPNFLLIDRNDDLYFADNKTIRKVTMATGIISHLFGTPGSSTTAGDGGLASVAQFRLPAGLALDSVGNFYICDNLDSTVRKVDAATGIISTVVGAAHIWGYQGDGGDATAVRLDQPLGIIVDPNDNLIIPDTANNVIRKYYP